jgi:hypothetical protein
MQRRKIRKEAARREHSSGCSEERYEGKLPGENKAQDAA